jgi:integrase/recombinase XerD
MNAKSFTSVLGPSIARYLALKEALGREYRKERAILTHLDRFLAAQPSKHARLTTKTFAQWSTTLVHLMPGVRRNHMRIARNLCLYRRRSHSKCFVPDPELFPKPHAYQPPHCFTEQQIVQILQAADRLGFASNSPFYREGMRLAVVVLYTSGLRRGELVRLRIEDYDSAQRTLHIRDTKFHKSRLVPLSNDAAREMTRYLRVRCRLPHGAEAPLLCNCWGGLRPYTGPGIAQALRRLFEQANVRTIRGTLPRVHDMRHSFALQALRRWYREGLDVQAKLPALAAYMGHISIVSTQHYLALVEPVHGAVGERFAQHCASFLTATSGQGGVR